MPTQTPKRVPSAERTLATTLRTLIERAKTGAVAGPQHLEFYEHLIKALEQYADDTDEQWRGYDY